MKKNIPFFSLQRHYKNIEEKIKETITQVLESQQFIGGPYVQNFEKKFSNYIKSNHTISCNSGTDALWMALRALGIQKNDIVLTTPYSFIASSSEIVSHGAHPVFIDIEEDSYNIDPKKLREWLENNCSASTHKETGYRVAGIVFVNIFGLCANYDEIKKIAEEYGLWTIEDACQSVGSVDAQSRTAGTLGDISCFSFYPTKNLGAFGDGGCCTTNNEYLAEKLMRIRNHGRHTHYDYIEHGVNSRLDAIQAAILSLKLDTIEKLNNDRNKIAKIYKEQLSSLDFIKLPQELNGKHTYHQYCIEIKNEQRDLLIQTLKENGIGTNIYFPKGLHQIKFLQTDERLKTDCPIATELSKNTLALPIWPELTREEVEYVCEKIKEIAIILNTKIKEKTLSI